MKFAIAPKNSHSFMRSNHIDSLPPSRISQKTIGGIKLKQSKH
jgi:hypothetical protein